MKDTYVCILSSRFIISNDFFFRHQVWITHEMSKVLSYLYAVLAAPPASSQRAAVRRRH